MEQDQKPTAPGAMGTGILTTLYTHFGQKQHDVLSAVPHLLFTDFTQIVILFSKCRLKAKDYG